jgi:hypothetical protein
MAVPVKNKTDSVKITTEWPHGLHPQAVTGIELKIPDAVIRAGNIIAKWREFAFCPVQGPVPLV